MPCTAHMPVPRSQIGRPTEVGGPSGSPVTCIPKPDHQADLVLPGRSRSLVKIGRMLEAVESGQIVIDPECRLFLGDNAGEPSMRAMCLLRAGVHRRHAIVIPVVLEMRGVAGQ